jgi:hypothetical protein
MCRGGGAGVLYGGDLADVMDTLADMLNTLIGAEKVKGYIVRMRDCGGVIYSLVYWLKTQWRGCEFYVKLYRKWGRDGVLRPVVGLSHVANCGGRLVWYPSLDLDGGEPPRDCLREAVFLWMYRGKKGVSAHVVLRPRASREEAVRVMAECGDDPMHLHFAMVPRYIEHFDFAVLRVSSYPAWGEEVLRVYADGDPIAELHLFLRTRLWYATPASLSA